MGMFSVRTCETRKTSTCKMWGTGFRGTGTGWPGILQGYPWYSLLECILSRGFWSSLWGLESLWGVMRLLVWSSPQSLLIHLYLGWCPVGLLVLLRTQLLSWTVWVCFGTTTSSPCILGQVGYRALPSLSQMNLRLCLHHPQRAQW